MNKLSKAEFGAYAASIVGALAREAKANDEKFLSYLLHMAAMAAERIAADSGQKGDTSSTRRTTPQHAD